MHEKTLAQKLGDTAIISPLKAKLRSYGISSTDQMEELAYQRGCSHYGESQNSETMESRAISDLELGIALLSGSNKYNPRLVRIGAQLISREKEAKKIYRLAIMERTQSIVYKIASDALHFEPQNPVWIELIDLLETSKKKLSLKAGVLPHRSRFIKQTGIRNPFKKDQPTTIWLR